MFQHQLPSYQSRTITGNDDYDKWTDQSTWDAMLENVRIVLSTHQVLLDALSHGFVGMQRLALLIFDEAHHCTGKHAANQIMQHFYLPLAHQGLRAQLPGILGLTASPVMKARASLDELKYVCNANNFHASSPTLLQGEAKLTGESTLEANLDAQVAVPQIHRSELMKYVHRPQLEMRQHHRNLSQLTSSNSPLLKALAVAYHGYDIMQDPYVASLRSRGDGSAAELEEVLSVGNTSCLKQLRSLYKRASTIYEELGGYSAEWFVRTCLTRYLGKIVHCSLLTTDLVDAEKMHLAQIFASLDRISSAYNSNDDLSSTSVDALSPKFGILLDVLTREHSTNLSGVIFVEQRATVFALAELLQRHPATKSSYKTAPFVGMSNYSKATAEITNLADIKSQKNTLEEFKLGERNLIVCTTVLEEGIDVPTCHLVICFDPPKNLKSFVQRRGRARKEQSKYIIFLDDADTSAQPAMWQSLEETLKDAYEDDLRRVREAAERETVEEENRNIHVSSTG